VCVNTPRNTPRVGAGRKKKEKRKKDIKKTKMGLVGLNSEH
jgi:hypothetical protein